MNSCQNFVATGRPSRVFPGKARRVIPDEILSWITSNAALNELKFMSMKERVQILWDKFAFKIGVHGLTSLYHRAGIAYRFSRPQSRKLLNDSGLIKADVREIRRTAAENLLNLLASGEPVSFVDECSIQS